MSWLFSQALVEEYSEAICSDGEQSVPSSGNPIPQAYCAPDKMMVFSRLSRFGMTYKPLTASRGEELLTLYLAVFPARTSQLRGGGGRDGERSGMWREMARIIGQVRPRYAFVENSPMLVTRGLERVLADLTSMGYDSRWGVISAADIGANHRRERIWIYACLGNTKSTRFPTRFKRQGQRQSWGTSIGSAQWWKTEPNVDRVVDGLASRVDRLKAIGNGQVPLCAATAWKLLSERI